MKKLSVVVFAALVTAPLISFGQNAGGGAAGGGSGAAAGSQQAGAGPQSSQATTTGPIGATTTSEATVPAADGSSTSVAPANTATPGAGTFILPTSSEVIPALPGARPAGEQDPTVPTAGTDLSAQPSDGVGVNSAGQEAGTSGGARSAQTRSQRAVALGGGTVVGASGGTLNSPGLEGTSVVSVAGTRNDNTGTVSGFTPGVVSGTGTGAVGGFTPNVVSGLNSGAVGGLSQNPSGSVVVEASGGLSPGASGGFNTNVTSGTIPGTNTQVIPNPSGVFIQSPGASTTIPAPQSQQTTTPPVQ